jgi:patatin-like phospholipase/acyl hydrolase
MDSVDLIAGTSAGGILSLMLAAGYTPQECEDLYAFAGE